MRRLISYMLVLPVALMIAGCAQPVGVPAPVSLSRPWMLGIEPMKGDPAPQLPFTNRFITDLAAMPNVQVVYVGTDYNDHTFSNWAGNKVRVSPWLHAEGKCMNLTYAVFQSGQQQAVFGLVVARPPAGIEPESACVNLATTEFYHALVMQGL